VHDIDIFINDKWRKYTSGDSSKLQGDFNFAFDQRENEVNLHKATSSPSNVSPGEYWSVIICENVDIVYVFIEVYRIR
jgi:hypothetical protein